MRSLVLRVSLSWLEELLVWQLWEQGTSFAVLLQQRFPLVCPEDTVC